MNEHQPRRSVTDCADVVLRLFEFVDDETGPLDREAIRSHLDECGACLAEYERDLLVKALIRRACACEPAPAALRSQIMTRITTTVTVIKSQQLPRD